MSILKYVDLYNQYKIKSGFLSITLSSKSSTKSEGPWGCWERDYGQRDTYDNHFMGLQGRTSKRHPPSRTRARVN